MDYNGEKELFDNNDICPLLASLTCMADITATTCGDGIVDVGEECDDGGTAAGDGCGATCEVECGYTCTRPLDGPSVCAPSCGNGVVDQLLGEECDSSEACCVGCKLIAGAVCCGGECCESDGSFRSR